MDLEPNPFADLNGFLDFITEGFEEETPELDLSPDTSVGSVMGSSVSESPAPAPTAGPLAGPAMPEAPQPEAPAAPQPEAPAAPKPMAGAGAPDGLSQITSTQTAQQDSRADSLFKD